MRRIPGSRCSEPYSGSEGAGKRHIEGISADGNDTDWGWAGYEAE